MNARQQRGQVFLTCDVAAIDTLPGLPVAYFLSELVVLPVWARG